MSHFLSLSLAANEIELTRCLDGPCEEGRGEGLGRWPFPKSDLFHWVPLLDCFDQMLEGVIEQFWSKETNLQQKPLTETIQRLVMRILEFTRLLLENCSSRNIYASYDVFLWEICAC